MPRNQFEHRPGRYPPESLTLLEGLGSVDAPANSPMLALKAVKGLYPGISSNTCQDASFQNLSPSWKAEANWKRLYQLTRASLQAV